MFQHIKSVIWGRLTVLGSAPVRGLTLERTLIGYWPNCIRPLSSVDHSYMWHFFFQFHPTCDTFFQFTATGDTFPSVLPHVTYISVHSYMWHNVFISLLHVPLFFQFTPPYSNFLSFSLLHVPHLLPFSLSYFYISHPINSGCYPHEDEQASFPMRRVKSMTKCRSLYLCISLNLFFIRLRIRGCYIPY